MIVLRSILVPTDFSEPSGVALKYGLALAEAFKASLHVLHAVEDPFSQPWAAEAYATPLGEVVENIKKEAQEQLEELLTPEQRAKFQVVLAVQLGRPYVSIVRYATDHRIDLVVMGTHGRGPVAHLLLGSVAESVVRGAPCPVLTVRHPEREFLA